MTTEKSLVPTGISHDIDLSKMNYDDRIKHHTAQLWSITKWQGLDGAKAYKLRYPEADKIRVDANPNAYLPKPTGYYDEIAKMVRHWFDSSIALASTNREDVVRLNGKLGTNRFDPDRFFSRPLSPKLRKKIAAVFDERLALLPDNAVTMSQVRTAVKAFKARAAPQGKPFGTIGTRTEQSLTIGSKVYRIEMYRGRECIRVTSGKTTQRIYLSILQEFISGLPVGEAVASPFPAICIYTGELVSAGEDNPKQGSDKGVETSSQQHSHISDNPADEPEPCLSDRIAILAANKRARQIIRIDDDDRDILEL